MDFTNLHHNHNDVFWHMCHMAGSRTAGTPDTAAEVTFCLTKNLFLGVGQHTQCHLFWSWCTHQLIWFIMAPVYATVSRGFSTVPCWPKSPPQLRAPPPMMKNSCQNQGHMAAGWDFGVVKGPMPGNLIQYKNAGETDWCRKSDYAFLDPTFKEVYRYSLWDTLVWSYLYIDLNAHDVVMHVPTCLGLVEICLT